MAKKALPTHSRILYVGTNLLTTAGFSGVTIGTLAQQSGMSKSGFFAHFGSKEELQLKLLENAAEIAREHVVAPCMGRPKGVARLTALVRNWFGWTTKAGLDGGCPVAAGMFELDDSEGPVRERLLQMESFWRGLLAAQVADAVALGELAADLDIGQFVWELCGIYLSHHASVRFVRDPKADKRAELAFKMLLKRAQPSHREPSKRPGGSRKGREKGSR
jgi:AcrR family transcriptional regulator